MTLQNITSAALTLLLTAGLLAGCATKPKDPEDRAIYKETNDPLEPMNRAIFGFNQIADKLVIHPVTKGYIYVVPSVVRPHISNVLSNLGEPVNFVNDLLQGRGHDAIDTVARFVMNTTVGLAGWNDVAGDLQVPEHHGDFGQTLYTWGVGSGPYLVLPLLGPSNPRDGVGIATDVLLIDPWGYVADAALSDDQALAIDITRYGLTVVDRRASTIDLTDKLEKESLDYYAAIRSIARQYRDKQLSGKAASVPATANIAPTGN